MLTNKQSLILLYIHTKFTDNSYRLIHIIDRFDFPINLTENINELINKDLLIITNKGTLTEYAATDKGINYLKKELNKPSLLEYVKVKNEGGVYFQITVKLLEQVT